MSMYCRPLRYGLTKVGILFHSAKLPLTKNAKHAPTTAQTNPKPGLKLLLVLEYFSQ